MSDPNPNPFENWMSKSKAPFWLNTSTSASTKPAAKTPIESPSTTNLLFLCIGAVASVALMLIGALVGSTTSKK